MLQPIWNLNLFHLNSYSVTNDRRPNKSKENLHQEYKCSHCTIDNHYIQILLKKQVNILSLSYK